MLEHGGIYHHYLRSFTKFVIASNLPDVKIRSNITKNIIKPEWIVDCLKEKRLLNYSSYLLHANKIAHQPQLSFKKLEPKNEEEAFEMSLDALNQKMQCAEEKTGTAVDANFLQEFLNNSRLHCIATMANSFKFYITELRKKHDGKFPERAALKSQLQRVEGCDHKSVIMHIDIDCFFVSVGLRNKPHLKGQPIAVTHSKGKSDKDNFMSMSEIASCSYEARAKGVKNGMFVGQALKLSPDLKTIPYDFEEYRKTAYKLYDTVAKYTLDIEAVSCDELYADLTVMLNDCKVDVMDFVTMLRQIIFDQTKCTCSVGIGANRLQARMATKEAKPNGQFELLSTNIVDYMKDKNVRDLPGVGRSTDHILQQLKLEKCGQIQEMPLVQLQNHFGKKFGETILMMAKGHDEKKLNYAQIRKSVSVDVNYGIRFNDYGEVKNFIMQVCEELSKRLDEIEKKGKCLTLKIMMRAKNASTESIKFMGFGEADKVSKSLQLVSSTSDPLIIYQNAISLLASLNIPPYDLRGIGVQISKLDDEHEGKSSKLLQMFKKMSENKSSGTERIKMEPNLPKPSTSPSKRSASLKRVASSSQLPSVADMFSEKKPSFTSNRKLIDPDILAELPPDIVEEILRDYDDERDATVEESESTAVHAVVNSEDMADNIFMNDGWRLKIISWIEASGPTESMIETLSCDMVQLIRAKNLEMPFLIMRFLHRHIESSARKEWQASYNGINCKLQTAMENEFDGRKLKLSVPENF
jgi:DNA repair protein REV1